MVESTATTLGKITWHRQKKYISNPLLSVHYRLYWQTYHEKIYKGSWEYGSLGLWSGIMVLEPGIRGGETPTSTCGGDRLNHDVCRLRLTNSWCWIVTILQLSSLASSVGVYHNIQTLLDTAVSTSILDHWVKAWGWTWSPVSAYGRCSPDCRYQIS